MTKRDHLNRLAQEYYQGESVVHWSLTLRDRQSGWLNVLFDARSFPYGLDGAF